MEFILCYTDLNSNDVWESVLGEDAMQCRVNELMEELNCEAEDIICFEKEQNGNKSEISEDKYMNTKERNELIKMLYANNDILEKLYQEVTEEERKAKVLVRDVRPGQTILVKDEEGEESWTSFRKDEEGNVYFLLDEDYEIKNVKFGNMNDYRGSHAQKVATTCSPVKRVQKAFGEDAFIPLHLDLFSHDGFRDYGFCDGDLTGVMTYDIYRNNREFIKPSWMWLSTPDSTPSGTGSSFVRCVFSNGGVCCNGCDWNDVAVRPFFILKSSILVSLKDEDNK